MGALDVLSSDSYICRVQKRALFLKHTELRVVDKTETDKTRLTEQLKDEGKGLIGYILYTIFSKKKLQYFLVQAIATK